MIREKTDHDMSLDQLIFKPGIIGIRDLVTWSAKELNIYKPESKALLTQIDLFYKTENGIYIAEYKGKNHKSEASRQLKLAAEFVEREFGIQPTKVYVTGPDFTAELIR